MREELKQKAELYARIRDARIVENPGEGVHGMVFILVHNVGKGRFAAKLHHHRETYERECAVYRRLGERGIDEVRGFHVPKLIGSNDEFLAVEMTIVTRPYVLDFAGAFLDSCPDFPDEAWALWEEQGQERFGERWTKVKEVVTEFKKCRIFWFDASPGNITFRD